MKRILVNKISLLAFMLLMMGMASAQNVTFSDINFKNALLAHDPVIDTSGDGEIQVSEAEAATEIDVYNYTTDITSLGGIEAFTNITSLNAGANALTSVDLSSNTALISLFLQVNQLGSIDVTALTELETLSIGSNLFSTIDLSQNTKLVTLYVAGVFYLNSLDVSALTELETFWFSSNGNLTSIDLSNNVKLRNVRGDYSNITSLDVSMLPDLDYLNVQNTQITSLDLTSNPNLTQFYALNMSQLTTLKLANGNNSNMLFGSVRVSNVPNLTCISVDDPEYAVTTWDTYFDVPVTPTKYCDLSDPVYIPDTNFKAALVGNASINTNEDTEISYGEAEAFTGTIQVNSGTEGVVANLTGVEAFVNLEVITMINHDITTFDASNHPNLRNLILPNNELTEIDITNNPALTFVNLQSNQISEIDLTNNTNLRTLKMSYNQLSEIDVSARTLLTELTLGSNNLSSVDITNNPDLQIFDGFDNTISTLDLSQNTALRYLNVANTNLTSLDVSACPDLLELRANSSELASVNLRNGANTELNVLNLINNFNLTCIEVDDPSYSVSNWSESVDETAEFRISCDPNAPVYIPDPNFKHALVNHNPVIDTNNDDEISYAEAEAYTGTLSAFNRDITDATGIEAFTNITQISMRLNDLTEIDISKNTEVTHIDFYANQIASLDVSKNTKLIRLDMSFHMLTDGIDLSNNVLLEELLLSGNGPTSLTSLDVSQNVNLRSLVVQNNPDLSSIDLSNNTELTTFTAVNDSFESIDFTNNTKLEYVNMSNNLLTSLDVSNSPNLVTLSIDNFGTNENAVSSLDVSNNPLLEGLYFQGNPITSIDVSNNPALKAIRISGSEVSALNLDSNPLLEVVQAENVLPLTSLSVLNGNNSNITTFNTTGSTNLDCIRVSDIAYAEANWTLDPANEFCCFVNIPDANFKAALVANNSIDTDMDDEISCDEAAAFTGTIQASDMGINSIAGIEHFTGITTLQVHGNNLTEVDLTANTALETLWLSRNSLNSIDLTNNTAITDLRIDTNPDLASLNVGALTDLITLHAHTTDLSSLTLSNNANLGDLILHTTSVESLDLSSNPNLWRVFVYSNELNELDLRNGNNSNITNFSADGNQLTCISVDDLNFARTNWTDIDEQTNFSTDCSNGANDILSFSLTEQTGAATINTTNHTIEIEVETGTSLTALEPTMTISERASISPTGAQDFTSAVTYTVTAENYEVQDWTVTVTEKVALGAERIKSLSVYPNPTTDFLRIGADKSLTVQLVDLNGRTLQSAHGQHIQLDLRAIQSGMYLLQVSDGKSTETKRIIKAN